MKDEGVRGEDVVKASKAGSSEGRGGEEQPQPSKAEQAGKASEGVPRWFPGQKPKVQADEMKHGSSQASSSEGGGGREQPSTADTPDTPGQAGKTGSNGKAGKARKAEKVGCTANFC